MPYPGGKEAAGTYQRIISQIPPHRRYIEPFVGGGAILRHKRPAEQSIVIDLERSVLDAIATKAPPHTQIIHGCGIAYLRGVVIPPDSFVYVDSPYMPKACSGPLPYRFVLTPHQHAELLAAALRLQCPVMISGYWTPLYHDMLQGWRTITFKQMTRGGHQQHEWLWMNYPEPVELHDYRYVGANFREREKFTRQQKRWKRRLQGMDILQRRALEWAIGQEKRDA